MIMDTLKKEGIREQKYVEFDGGHGVHKPHITEVFK